jgi:hypothetical protein
VTVLCLNEIGYGIWYLNYVILKFWYTELAKIDISYKIWYLDYVVQNLIFGLCGLKLINWIDGEWRWIHTLIFGSCWIDSTVSYNDSHLSLIYLIVDCSSLIFFHCYYLCLSNPVMVEYMQSFRQVGELWYEVTKFNT